MTALDPELTRRAVVAGACVAAAATAAGCAGLGAAGSGDGAGAGGGEGGRGGAGDPGGAGGAGGEQTLGSTTDIPIGGGVVFTELGVVVTQPSKGDIRAFSAICTHRGCTVSSVADGTINCPCHGSTFSSSDGSVVQGPAQEPLSERQVIVEGTSLKLV